jgi:hypothetical protein
MIEEVLNSYRKILNDARRMVADLSEAQMRFQPMGMNPPSWILGHLVFSAQAMGGELKISPWLPANWVKAFRTGSRPADQESYPTKDELTNALKDAYEKLSKRLRELGDEGMSTPLPDEKNRQTMPTLGHAIVHILSGHASLHVGQLSAWRRAIGLAGGG